MKLLKNEIFPQEDICFHVNDETHHFPFLHSHDYYETFIVLSGNLFHELNGECRKLFAGSIMIIFPEDCHQMYIKEKCHFCNIAYSVETMEHLFSLLHKDPHDFPREGVLNHEDLARYDAQCKKIAALQNQQSRSLQLKSMLSSCIADMATTSIPPQTAYPAWLSDLLLRLSNPELFTLQTKEICSIAGYTPEYVSRCFRKYLNTTLTDYLRSLRLNYAGGLLSSTNLPILDVCFECGFQNLNYFYRCFHKEYGISPKVYRERHGVLF